MSNYEDTKAELANYLSARIPLVIIRSQERDRVERMLNELSSEKNERIFYYTDAGGVVSFGGNTSLHDRADGGIMKYIYEKFQSEKLIFAVGDARHLEDNNLFTKDVLDVLYKAKEKQCTLILITSGSVWTALSRFGMITTLDYPDQSERVMKIREFIKDNPVISPVNVNQRRFMMAFGRKEKKQKSYVEWDEEDIIRAATLLRGFSEIQIENVLLTLLKKKTYLKREDISELTEQKSRLYAAVPTIEHVTVKQDLYCAGLTNLKNWLRDNKKFFFMDEEDLSKRDLESPKGVLLAGIPGCGKSLSAKVVANEWELPLFRFDIGSIYDKWMGNSEKRMEDALTFIDNVAPCILWIDEIEKALSVSDSNNDTGQRIIGKLLFWLQESTSRVFLIATANNIEHLPPELYRKGRFSELFYIDLPNAAERREIIRLYAEKSLLIDPEVLNMDALVDASEGFSYSDIEQCIKDVAKMAVMKGQNVITDKLLLSKFHEVVSISKSNPELIDKLRKWGSEKALPASGEEKQ